MCASRPRPSTAAKLRAPSATASGGGAVASRLLSSKPRPTVASSSNGRYRLEVESDLPSSISTANAARPVLQLRINAPNLHPGPAGHQLFQPPGQAFLPPGNFAMPGSPFSLAPHLLSPAQLPPNFWGPPPSVAALRDGEAPPPRVKIEEIAPMKGVQWFALDDDAALVSKGFPAMAPALVHDTRLQDLLSSASYILYELAGDSPGQAEFEHDWEWTEYPEVGEVLKQAGGPEMPLCIASIGQEKKKWAVGLATNSKHRVQTAKLALCVALAADAEYLQDTLSNHPGFRELCEASGIFTGENQLSRGTKRGRWGLTGAEVATKAKRPRNYKTMLCKEYSTTFACLRGDACNYAHGEDEIRAPGELKVEPEEEGKPDQEAEDVKEPAEEPAPATPLPSVALGPLDLKDGLPRDKPVWIELDSTEVLPEQLEGMPLDALALSTTGMCRKALYAQADSVLSHALGPEASEVEFMDDFDWKHFPAVGSALKKLSKTEECLTVGICPGRSLWAVGVGMKGKNRWVAAKVAIAAAVSLQQVEILDEPVDFSEFPAMAEFVKEAGAAKQAHMQC